MSSRVLNSGWFLFTDEIADLGRRNAEMETKLQNVVRVEVLRTVINLSFCCMLLCYPFMFFTKYTLKCFIQVVLCLTV